MINEVLKITGVNAHQKAKLKKLTRLSGYQNVSEFMRSIIATVCAQDNLNFIIDDDIKSNLITSVNLLNRLIEIQNQNTEELVTIEKILTEWLVIETHGEEDEL